MNNDCSNPVRRAIDECLAGLAGRPSLRGKVLERVRSETKVKKKLSAGLALALVLALAAVTALAVGAFTGWFKIKQADVGAMRGCVSTGDVLYLISDDGFYSWTPGEKEPATLIPSGELREQGLSSEVLLYMDGNAVGLMDTENKKLWHYRDNTLTLQHDYAGTAMDIPDMRYQKAVCRDGRLYLLARPRNAMDNGSLLYRADPLTGEAERLSVPAADIDELCAYEPGRLLLLGGDVQQHSQSLMVYDTDTGSVCDTLFTAPIQRVRGIAYSKEQGGLYALADGALSRWNGTDWTALNASAPSFMASSFAVVDGGYVSVSYDEMQYLPFSPVNEVATLTIRGYISGDNADADFQEAYGVAVIRRREPTLTAAQVREAIQAGDTTDLFYLRLEGDMVKLIQDGLAAPLSSDMLVADARELTPAVGGALLAGDRLYAVAAAMSPVVWQSEAAIPDTFTKLLSQIGAPDGGFAIAHNGADSPWTRRDYANALLEAFIAESAQHGGSVDFHNAAFASTLEALRGAEHISHADKSAQVIKSATVISLGGEFLNSLPEGGRRQYKQEAAQPDEPHWLLPPTIAEGAEPSVPARLLVYVLNPNAQSPDAAVKYLEYIATNRAAGDEGLLKPDSAIPVLHSSERQLIDWIIETQREDDKAAGVETDEAALSARTDAVRAAPGSWAITENRLNTYRNAFLPYIDLRLHPLLSYSSKAEGGAYELLLKTMLNYAEGKGTLEECLDDLQAISAEHGAID